MIVSNFEEVVEVVRGAIAVGVAPGAAFAVGSSSAWRSWSIGAQFASGEGSVGDAIWDLASLTKVIATTALVESSPWDLDAPVVSVLPEFASPAATFRQLLLHESGLPASVRVVGSTPEEVRAEILATPLEAAPGSRTVYSDVGFVALGVALERRAGESLDRLFVDRIAGPLEMNQTCFNPSLALRRRCAPTEPVEPWRADLREVRGEASLEIAALETDRLGRRWIRGEVHDPTAYRMGKVAGHAGLFGSVDDLARFAQAMLRSSSEAFTRRAGPNSSRALGWDTPEPGSSGEAFGPRAYGHTGFTGTSLWCDPDADLFAILLTNRVHPSASDQRIRRLRRDFHDAVMRDRR